VALVSFLKTSNALSIRSFPALGLETILLNNIVSVTLFSSCVPSTTLTEITDIRTNDETRLIVSTLGINIS
jgi:hypothetical protein